MTDATTDDATTGITLRGTVGAALGKVTADTAYDKLAFYDAATRAEVRRSWFRRPRRHGCPDADRERGRAIVQFKGSRRPIDTLRLLGVPRKEVEVFADSARPDENSDRRSVYE